MVFEYRPATGVHALWNFARSGSEHQEVLEDLSAVEDAIAEGMAQSREQHATEVVLVRGGDGWREITYADSTTTRYQWTLVERDFGCTGCGYDTWDEGYRVDDVVWSAAGPGGRLCIGCLEERLGRALTPADFVDHDDNIETMRPTSPRLRARRELPRPPRPDITFHAPIGSIDLRAFNEVGEAYEITACMECLPWRAEVVTDPETNEILVREWHAVECAAFLSLLED
ncbi:hypothetical protein MycrhDRAFT_5606 [Mycolicibacterium rhodesiae JS60]|nr:hypothetical protein MycrhDRAFT_5606 [Mycolicibacterium rhodesiae JS60]